MKFGNWLKENGACKEGFNAHSHQTEQEFWNTCNRGDWMLWVAQRKYGTNGWPDHLAFVKIACIVGRRSLIHCRENDKAVCEAAYDTAEKFIESQTEENRNAANSAAYAAAYAAAANAYYTAAYAAYAASAAANAASYSANAASYASYAAAYASYAAAYAAYAAAYDEASYSAYTAAYYEEKKIQADIIRQKWPKVGA